MDAGVGQPVGVLGLTGKLVIAPVVISSASRTGVKRVFSAEGPAPETPGTVESRVLARIPQKTGRVQETRGTAERKAILFNCIYLHRQD
jgi:hypothetical protein